MKRSRVAVMMSGGVDSSVAAGLLAGQGYEVTGFTLRIYRARRGGRCCGLSAVKDAQLAARVLGVPHHVLDYREIFRREVIEPFRRAYLAGQTPNPCVVCNERIKFTFFSDRAGKMLDAFTATGHYARISPADDGPRLLRARDTRQDQSYFLYRIRREELKKILFPLGGMSKAEVRLAAREMGLPNAEKKGSQEICFTEGLDYGSYLSLDPEYPVEPGPVTDLSGKVLGRHRGIAFYTVGQRAGLGISAPHPLYVVAINPATNTVCVGSRQDACRKSFLVGDTNWLAGEPEREIRAMVSVRYRSREIDCLVRPAGNGLYRVELDEPQFAVTPGQSAVFYRGETVLGGGIIFGNP